MFTELVDFLCQKELHKEALELLRQFGQEERVDSRAMRPAGPTKDDWVLAEPKGRSY